MIVWDISKNYSKLANLKGHTCRVLHMSLSPDGTTVVSAAGDQTLRFWKVFPSIEKNTILSDSENDDSDLAIKSFNMLR